MLQSADLHGSLLKQVNSSCETRAGKRAAQDKLDREKRDRQRVAELHERSLRAVRADGGRWLAAQAVGVSSARAVVMPVTVDVMGGRQILMQQARPDLIK